MKKALMVLCVLGLVGALAAYAVEAAAAAKTAAIFVCGKCNAVALAAGKHCDQDMAAMHVLAVEGKDAVCCACGADCKCTVNADDKTQCGCGKDVKKVALKGMFVCCDGVISDKAGKCACGKDLKKVE